MRVEGHEDGSPKGQDLALDRAWFTTAVPAGHAPKIEHSVIEPRVDRAYVALHPTRKDHKSGAVPSHRQN